MVGERERNYLRVLVFLSGKLKLSSEMKEKLEAVHGSRKSSVRSTDGPKRSELDIESGTTENGIRKLAENRKLLLEQKLGGGRKKRYNETIFLNCPAPYGTSFLIPSLTAPILLPLTLENRQQQLEEVGHRGGGPPDGDAGDSPGPQPEDVPARGHPSAPASSAAPGRRPKGRAASHAVH